MEVVAYLFAAFLEEALTPREDVLPQPLGWRVRVLPGEGVGEACPAVSRLEIPSVRSSDGLQVPMEWRLEQLWEQGQSVRKAVTSARASKRPLAAMAPGVPGGGAASGDVPRRAQSAAEGHPAPLPSNLPAKGCSLSRGNHLGEFARGG